jgi:hypothetical protein
MELPWGVWSVVQCELRQASRRAVNFWLRVLGGAGGTVLLCVIAGNNQSGAATLGIRLFTALHCLLLVLILGIVPAMTADCIARERREGTLGLLFLTNLTAAGIVVGKGLVQALRAFTLWLAVLPVVTVPFLIGGVAWEDVTSAVAMQFSVAVLCLAGGILASAVARARGAAFMLALIFALGLVSVFVELLGFSALSLRQSPTADVNFWSTGISLLTGLPQLGSDWAYYVSNPMSFESYLGWSSHAATASVERVWSSVCLGSVILAPVLSLLIFIVAAYCVKGSWKDRPPSLGRQRWGKRFCMPLSVLQKWLARRMHRSLDRNPIAWLQQYSWKARVSKWGLCLGIVVVECVVAMDWRNVELLQELLVLGMGVFFTFAGVNSFLAEKRSGALELILVTPLPVNQIIAGRVWGLWKQFLPCGLIIIGSTLMSQIAPVPMAETLAKAAPILASFMVLPVFATYFALRVKNLIVAALLTWAALLLSWLFGLVYMLAMDDFTGGRTIWRAMIAIPLSDAAMALLVCLMLRHSLSRRIYSF